ncbi:YtzI protein [Neobacillus mesonae]|uniref:YtzI protein n=1 Tax=Neobacillus mesonae TaxID=1193713 RepID=UPI00203A5941|nr:YtzI protein [Neobacillus mesonae]MCM3571236.1 YtzI protein [Neobacillus mesonae]
MTIVLIVSIIIIFVVMLLAVITTSKAYSFKHTIDPDPGEANAPFNQAKDEKEAQ